MMMIEGSQWRRPSNGPLASLSACVPLLLCIAFCAALLSGQQAGNGLGEQQPSTPPLGETLAAERASPVPGAQHRPRVQVNVREWSRRVSDDIRLVSNRSSCTHKIAQVYQREGQFQRAELAKLRDSIVSQMNALLSQHRAALNSIVAEAEQAAYQHVFVKELRVNYTDVHRLRNELESQQAQQEQELAAAANAAQMALGGGSSSAAMSTGGQSTSISGGTPVPGAPEWQTPLKTMALVANRNFGDLLVNLSASAVHLPLPIYAGLPQIMNGIAWSEQLDKVFRRNAELLAQVHHQYYGDHLGFMRTYPAHKWRIPRAEPDLFDVRMRPWYIAGASTPKDMVILIDTSGSMTGLRREIAKGVVFEILDTLTISDHFAVMRFAESVTPLGLPKCAQLRQPRLAPQLELECPTYYHPHHAGQAHPHQQHNQPVNVPGDFASGHLFGQPPVGRQQRRHLAQPVATSGAAGALAGTPLDSALECANFRSSWDSRGQYLRDHPNIVPGHNGSYLADDAYRRSIGNVSADIRDAYLLPATARNIRYLKSNFSMPTAGIANFTHALMAAFELLQAYNRTQELGSQCQQAIMLITDGAIRDHEELFNRYNYPGAPVRLFTYMIGREVGNIGPTKQMACRNRGYYAHVINLSEVREQVQKYLPVMARPLVLSNQRPVSWTNAYGDETYQVLTDWVLELKRRERARIIFNEERERLNEANSSDVINIELTNIAEYDELPLVDEQLKDRIICEDLAAEDAKEAKVMEQSLADELDPLGYNELGCHWASRRAELLTSVVKPVFDIKKTSLFFERVLSKNVWTERDIQVRNAQLLGVAAVDLRVAELLRAAPSHLLGPNAYAILLGQNGFVLHHPDHRPLLEDPFDKQSKILKPHFNVVDLTHLEQAYSRASNESGAEAELVRKLRQDDIKVVKLREAALRRATGSETITVKRAIDCRRRPHVRQQVFFYGPIRDTPYSFMLTAPKSYGLNRLQAKLDLSKSTQLYFSPSEYDLLTVNSEYRYCERVGQQDQPVNQNDSLLSLLEVFKLAAEDEARAERAIEYADLNAYAEQAPRRRQKPAGSPADQIKYICDKELFPSLLFDARATYEPPGGSALCCMQPSSSSSFLYSQAQPSEQLANCQSAPDEYRSTLAKSFGLELSFLATRSGLTRTRVFDLSARIKKLAALFIERHSRALDEAWYARTVDWNMRSSEQASSTLISVPYNAHVRLVAKLRQRITQRHPAANDTRANCDPQLYSSDSADYADASTVADSASSSSSSSTQASAAAASRESRAISLDGGVDTADSWQNDEQTGPPETSSSSQTDQTGDNKSAEPPGRAINYAEFSSYDFLDLLANSSVHVAATQTIVVNSATDQRTPVGVTGHLYDYATFARRFFNTTSLSIQTLEEASIGEATAKVQICPNGECPTRCGLRSDSIDCLLVDNNAYIVVGEELVHVGRSLADYDERLLASLVERKIFQPIIITDFQAICARNDQLELASRQAQAAQQQAAALAASAQAAAAAAAAASSSSTNFRLASSAPAKFELAASLLANFARALVYSTSALYSAFFLRFAVEPDELLRSSDPHSFLGQLYQWQRSVQLGAEAQSAVANQSLLALLPNKTYLRPCEKQLTLYELRSYERAPIGHDAPHYYETKCGCSGWYVYDYVPETNLVMLLVNTSSACRRCDQAPSQAGPSGPSIDLAPLPASASNTLQQILQPVARTQAEDQVCAMLERDAPLYIPRSTACLASHPDEAQIHLCGAAFRPHLSATLVVVLLAIACAAVNNFVSLDRRKINPD